MDTLPDNPDNPDNNAVLEIRDLTTCPDLEEGCLIAVDAVSLTIRRHGTPGLTDEAGWPERHYA